MHLPLGLHKGYLSQKSHQLFKENTQHFLAWSFFTIFFLLFILSFWIQIQPTNINADPCGSGSTALKQCCGSGSTGSTCFWASRIRIRIRILISLSKNSKRNLDLYCFVTSFWLFIFEKLCKSTLKVPSHQIRSAWKWYRWIGSHGY